MRELSTYIDHDVEQRLRATCDIFRADVANRFAQFNEMQQNLEQ